MGIPHTQTEPEGHAAATAASEAERLEALARYEILDTPPERLYEDALEMAAALARVPIAALTFVDRDRDWVKAIEAAPPPEVSREGSFGGALVADGQPVVVQDV